MDLYDGLNVTFKNSGNSAVDKANKEIVDMYQKEFKKKQKEERRKEEAEYKSKKKELQLQKINADAKVMQAKKAVLQAPPDQRTELLEAYNNAVQESSSIYSELNNYADFNTYHSYKKDQNLPKPENQNTEGKSSTDSAEGQTSTGDTTDKASTGNTEGQTSTGSTDSQSTEGQASTGSAGGSSGSVSGRSPRSFGMVEGHGSSIDPSGKSQQLRNQAQMHERQAIDEQKNSQANMQVANRNYRVEAEKNAVSQAASENAQKVANMGNASAGAAALERGVATADYNTHMQRQDQQRAEGVKNQREMWGSKQTAEEERGSANITDYKWRDTDRYNRNAADLSDGGSEPTPEEPAPTPEPAEPETTPEPEEPAPEPKKLSGSPQHVINGLLGSSKGEDLRQHNSQNADDQELFDYVVQKYQLTPAPLGALGNNALAFEKNYLASNNYGGNKQEAIQFLRSMRAGENNDASTNYVANGNNGYTAISPGKGSMNMHISSEADPNGEYNNWTFNGTELDK